MSSRRSRASPSTPSSERREFDVARSINIGRPARTGRSVARRISPLPPRPLCVRGIGFAPETIAPAKRDLPHLSFVQEMSTMTAYLISLATAGLIALAVCDALL